MARTERSEPTPPARSWAESGSAVIPVVATVAELRRTVGEWRAAGETVALVPTMGALHEGHITLVHRALAACDRAVVSVFVNPTQFAPSEDYVAYPRTPAADAEMLRRAGAHLVYAPEVGEMYPPGFATTVLVGGVTEGLCGAFRPGHFAGVATVVAKLLIQAGPDAAVFGEKDYQQLLTIKRLARDLDLPVEIIGVPTVREPDGLAMSSRNAYLSAAERRIASTLYPTLTDLARRLEAGRLDAASAAADGPARLLAAGFDAVDYVELRRADDLARLPPPGDGAARGAGAIDGTGDGIEARLLAAVRLGRARLIDNIPVRLPPPPG